ncbi:hypothetical protein COCON_G00099080 [Conger conger]|uniref:Uncharacterized protein n=1 Tax=Conger conger TaxID=82655 RepID=A0A9Q1DMM5_CONCO|nr:hypothetical protein COCON_G00099080 [Conger conger]
MYAPNVVTGLACVGFLSLGPAPNSASADVEQVTHHWKPKAAGLRPSVRPSVCPVRSGPIRSVRPVLGGLPGPAGDGSYLSPSLERGWGPLSSAGDVAEGDPGLPTRSGQKCDRVSQQRGVPGLAADPGQQLSSVRRADGNPKFRIPHGSGCGATYRALTFPRENLSGGGNDGVPDPGSRERDAGAGRTRRRCTWAEGPNGSAPS